METFEVSFLENEKLKREISLPTVNMKLISEYVRYQNFASKGTKVPAQTRSQVTCSGRKLRPQKGTGRAAVGDASSPVLRGGGVAHGPKLRKPLLKMNKKAKKKAVLSALNLNREIISMNDDLDVNLNKTSDLREWLSLKGLSSLKVLYVTTDKVSAMASNNIFKFKFLPYDSLNVRDILLADKILLRGEVLVKLQNFYGVIPLTK